MQFIERHQVKTHSYTSNMKFLAEDLIFFKRDHYRERRSIEIDTFSSVWTLGIAEFKPHQIAIHRKGEQIRKEGLWAIFIPPFSLVQWEIAPGLLQWRAYLSTAPVADFLPKEPIIFPWNQLWNPVTVNEIFNCVSAIENYIPVGKEEKSSSVAQKTKTFIDQNFNTDIKFSEVASRLNFVHSVMTRSFKKAYGLSPIAYRNKLRVFESIKHMLFEGHNVARAGQEVGFCDTSRFSKQFRRQISARPSQYLKPKKV